jgi:hypothetical protein
VRGVEASLRLAGHVDLRRSSPGLALQFGCTEVERPEALRNLRKGRLRGTGAEAHGVLTDAECIAVARRLYADDTLTVQPRLILATQRNDVEERLTVGVDTHVLRRDPDATQIHGAIEAPYGRRRSEGCHRSAGVRTLGELEDELDRTRLEAEEVAQVRRADPDDVAML